MRRLGILFLVLFAVTGQARADGLPPYKFVVFFQQWSAALDDSAQAVITDAAGWVKAHPTAVANVNGFADTTGSKQANLLLTELRAQMVVDQLLADGVDAKRIRQRGHGSVQYSLSSQESRRVEISVTPN
jgi:outer membrane protein OmpA-like peptidoglycan-associated protein